MNWFKRIFCSQDEFNGHVDQWGLPSVENIVPMPKVKAHKADKDISEPVYAIVKNMLDHPQRWKVKIKTTFSTHSSTTSYMIKDTKTGEEFKVVSKYYHGFGVNEDKDVYVSWVTKQETQLLEQTLRDIYEVKKV